MATSSGSLREKKPESVQFWLAITAGSLFLHSLFMFGVSRSVQVSVVEPGGGAIDVEMVDPTDFQAAAGEPIVPAAAFKPEPAPEPEFSPAPEPEPSPEPTLKPEEKPIVKPEVRKPIVKSEVKKPIAPPPNSTKGPTAPGKTTPRTGGSKKGEMTPTESGEPLVPPGKPGKPTVRSVPVSYEDQPEQESSNNGDSSKPDAPSKLLLGKISNISIASNSPLLPATITVQFAAICPTSTNNECDPTQVKLRRIQASVSYTGSVTPSAKDLEDLENWATEIVSKLTVSKLTIDTSVKDKPDTLWSVTFILR